MDDAHRSRTDAADNGGTQAPASDTGTPASVSPPLRLRGKHVFYGILCAVAFMLIGMVLYQDFVVMPQQRREGKARVSSAGAAPAPAGQAKAPAPSTSGIGVSKDDVLRGLRADSGGFTGGIFPTGYWFGTNDSAMIELHPPWNNVSEASLLVSAPKDGREAGLLLFNFLGNATANSWTDKERSAFLDEVVQQAGAIAQQQSGELVARKSVIRDGRQITFTITPSMNAYRISVQPAGVEHADADSAPASSERAPAASAASDLKALATRTLTKQQWKQRLVDQMGVPQHMLAAGVISQPYDDFEKTMGKPMRTQSIGDNSYLYYQCSDGVLQLVCYKTMLEGNGIVSTTEINDY